jgi:hypothetical protein
VTATIVPAAELARRREERERYRQERQPFVGSILGLLDEEPDPPCAPASPAQQKETKR